MKRTKTSYLLNQIAKMENLEVADKMARRNKIDLGIVLHDNHKESDLLKLQQDLLNCSYVTSQYTKFIIHEPKEREISKLPYYPDRITHWAILLILEPIWVSKMISSSYSCIKDRGIHKCVRDVKQALLDKENTKYCLKLDIKKFYPSINHEILKGRIRNTIKDIKLLKILDGIIDSSDGIPIGNYLSQFFANLYLTELDHVIKERLKAKYYFRYMDDMVLLSGNKETLHEWKNFIDEYVTVKLKVELKNNWQIFPIEARGIDFVGYKFYHKYIKLRKSIKQRILKLCYKYQNNKISKSTFLKRFNSYLGWLKYCNSINFLKRVHEITGLEFSSWNGKNMSITNFKKIWKESLIKEIVKHKKYFDIHFIYKSIPYSAKSENFKIFNYLKDKHNIKIIDIC